MLDPKTAVIQLCEQKYSNAAAIFWTGSAATGNYTSCSDLDLVIVFDKVPNAYREAFSFEGWKIDAFIHDIETMHYFFDEIDRNLGEAALAQMVLTGTLITQPSPLSEKIRELATQSVKNGPPPWSKEEMARARFFITDLLDDIISPRNRSEQLASAARLYELLAVFYFRAQNKWSARGKIILRYLKDDNYDLAEFWRDAFDDVFNDVDVKELERLVVEILEPYGGFLWEGFYSGAPENWRKS